MGVYIDCELKFHKHVAAAANKANSILGMTRNTFNHITAETLPLIFTTLVRPHLEYGNIIWHPRYVMDITAIEAVQHRATKMIHELKHLPYQERLQQLNLHSLHYRRKRGDMIQVYKIITEIDRIDQNHFFTPAVHQSTRGHPLKLFKKRARLEMRKHAFSMRIVDDWNSLPLDCVTADSLDIFKNCLDRFWWQK